MNSITTKRNNIKFVVNLNGTDIIITRTIYTVTNGVKTSSSVTLQPQKVRITKNKFTRNPVVSEVSGQKQAEWLLFAEHTADIKASKNIKDTFMYDNKKFQVMSVVTNTENGETTSLHATLKVIQ